MRIANVLSEVLHVSCSTFVRVWMKSRFSLPSQLSPIGAFSTLFVLWYMKMKFLSSVNCFCTAVKWQLFKREASYLGSHTHCCAPFPGACFISCNCHCLYHCFAASMAAWGIACVITIASAILSLLLCLCLLQKYLLTFLVLCLVPWNVNCLSEDNPTGCLRCNFVACFYDTTL